MPGPSARLRVGRNQKRFNAKDAKNTKVFIRTFAAPVFRRRRSSAQRHRMNPTPETPKNLLKQVRGRFGRRFQSAALGGCLCSRVLFLHGDLPDRFAGHRRPGWRKFAGVMRGRRGICEKFLKDSIRFNSGGGARLERCWFILAHLFWQRCKFGVNLEGWRVDVTDAAVEQLTLGRRPHLTG